MFYDRDIISKIKCLLLYFSNMFTHNFISIVLFNEFETR